MDDDVRYIPQFELDSGDPEFLRGCELGRLQARLELLSGTTLRELVRRSNTEMLRRMVEASERSCSVQELDEEWSIAIIEPASSVRDQL